MKTSLKGTVFTAHFAKDYMFEWIPPPIWIPAITDKWKVFCFFFFCFFLFEIEEGIESLHLWSACPGGLGLLIFSKMRWTWRNFRLLLLTEKQSSFFFLFWTWVRYNVQFWRMQGTAFQIFLHLLLYLIPLQGDRLGRALGGRNRNLYFPPSIACHKWVWIKYFHDPFQQQYFRFLEHLKRRY